MTSGAGAEGARISIAGDSALMLELPQRIDPAINDRARRAAGELRDRWGSILRDVVVGYCTVTVYFDPLRLDARWLESELQAAAAAAGEGETNRGALVEIPTCYDPDLAPDLPDVAAFAGCTAEEVVRRHSSAEYRVYTIGFIPGFAYLAEVHASIAAPRRTSPRALVAAGSVGIAGGQTGIYPASTPGGWNLIGRTWVKPYDPEREPPVLFRIGDTVRFVPVTREEFDARSGPSRVMDTRAGEGA